MTHADICPALLTAHRRVVEAHAGTVPDPAPRAPDDIDIVGLFGETVHPVAAEVRLRMLRHLGIVPDSPAELDDDRLAALPLGTITATDLWLVASTSTSVTAAMPGLAALGAGVTDASRGSVVSAVRARYGP